jgi:hypothetical protein
VILGPVDIEVPNFQTVNSQTIVNHRRVHQQPLLLLFAESLKGNLNELMSRIAEFNKSVPVSLGVSGAFVLNEGFILHVSRGEGWNLTRLAGFPLAYVPAEPWEVLLKLMTLTWNQIARVTASAPDLGAYYADASYFHEIDEPRAVVHIDDEYTNQTEEGFVSTRG